MQRVYDSEINATVAWFWDGGFLITLGYPEDPEAEGQVRTWREVETWLREKILEHHPDSTFSKEERSEAS